MSKVVHLSDRAHNQAKSYCEPKGIRMSDWVAELIESAVGKNHPKLEPVLQRNAQSKKKILEKLEAMPQVEQAEVAAYTAPPFWANAKHS